MTISNSKSLAEILASSNTRLGRLVRKAKQQAGLTELFRAASNHELAHHCQVGSFDGKTLHLIADSAAWATKLRYAIPDLIKTLKVQPEFKTLEKIRFSLSKQR